MHLMKPVIFVGLGGFLGAVCRYLVHLAIQYKSTSVFPWATFIVNLVGCFLIGVIFSLAARNKIANEELRLFLAAGFCGSFTTFSTFSLENFHMMQSGNYLQLGLYTLLSWVLGILGVMAGIYLFRQSV